MLWLDLLRIVAICCVVTIHVVSLVTEGVRVPMLSATWWIGASMDAGSLWCVPVFVMISGALLLNPAREQPARVFYRRRLDRIAVPLVAWSAIYFAFRNTVLDEHLTTATVVKDVGRGHPYIQLYYLFVIAGLYAVTPPLRRLLSTCSRRQWAWLAAGAVAYAVIDAALRVLVHVGGVNAVSQWLDWVGYFLLGGLLRRTRLPRWSGPAAVLAFVGSIAATVGLAAAFSTHYGWDSPSWYWFDYASPTVVVMSVAAFVIGRAVGDRWSWQPGPWLGRIAGATFGVFLIHPLLVTPYVRHIGVPTSPVAFAVVAPAVVLAVVALTTVATFAIERLPVLRRLV